ncbi:hypothetical protein J6590_042607 [Homalodisca vitripennis]|nr:hypothetical protein J6590_042607 [Homalodisca vitripennis]
MDYCNVQRGFPLRQQNWSLNLSSPQASPGIGYFSPITLLKRLTQIEGTARIAAGSRAAPEGTGSSRILMTCVVQRSLGHDAIEEDLKAALDFLWRPENTADC